MLLKKIEIENVYFYFFNQKENNLSKKEFLSSFRNQFDLNQNKEFITLSEFKVIQKELIISNKKLMTNYIINKLWDEIYYLSHMEHINNPYYSFKQEEICNMEKDTIKFYIKKCPRIFLNALKIYVEQSYILNGVSVNEVRILCEHELLHKKNLKLNKFKNNIL